MTKKAQIYFSVFLIIIAGFFVYVNSLSGEFLLDDRYLVTDNTYVKNPVFVKNIFTQNIGEGAGIESNSYRPLQMLTYMADYRVWGLNPRGYHITNIVFHILAALCLYWFVTILFENRLISLITSLLFVIHPIHTEAVSYISGRADPMSLLFMLLSFIFYIKSLGKNNPIIYLLMLSSYALALLSRESALILPVLLLLYHYAFKRKIEAAKLLSISGIAAIYLILRFNIIEAPLPHSASAIPAFQRIPGFFVAVTNYARLLILPFGLHMEYGDWLFNIMDPRAIAGIAIMAALLIAAFKSRKKGTGYFFENDKAGKSSLSPFFALMWFIITLLPQSNIYPVKAYMAEHWLYVPSIGFFLILAYLLNSLYENIRLRTFAVSITLCLALFYSVLTVRQNNYWREPITFYERTLKYAPDSARAHNDFGIAHESMGNEEEAIAAFNKAIETDPNYANAYNNIGVIHMDAGRTDDAARFFKKSIELDPGFFSAYSNLGIIQNTMGNYDEAIAAFKKALEINPNFANAHNNLGVVYGNLGRTKEAIPFFKKALEINPQDGPAHSNLAAAYYYEKEYGLAVRHSEIAIELGVRMNPELLGLLAPHRK